MKLKIKLLKNRFIYVVYCILILKISYFLDRFFQMFLFVIFFNLIQNCFSKRFHADTIFSDNPIKAIRCCKIITIGVEILYLIFCKKLDVSLYSNLFIIFFIAFTNSLLQFFLERTITNKCKLSDLESLTIMCNEANLSELATKRMVLKYVEKKTYREIANIECVEEDTIKQSIIRSRRKLNIKN